MNKDFNKMIETILKIRDNYIDINEDDFKTLTEIGQYIISQNIK